MGETRESQLLLASLPVYAAVIGAEMLYSAVRRRGLYSARGLLANIYLTSLNMGVDALLRGFCLLVLDLAYGHRLADPSSAPVAYWALLIVFEDFMYYWLHRVDHRCRFFWAVHVTHHSSEEFNLTVGFRSSVFQPLYRFVYFIPIALCGFKGIDILFVYSATQIFGTLVHTQTIGRLGLLEHVLVTPSHHRVHHASNPIYRDRNMGMLLIVWDKLFGTFQAEQADEPVRYGLGKAIRRRNPMTMVLHEWADIVDDLCSDTSLKSRLMYLFAAPGWRHEASSAAGDDAPSTRANTPGCRCGNAAGPCSRPGQSSRSGASRRDRGRSRRGSTR
jgi:sterol desaturase/sphingolipid hydroxylase (fatty acid hydroxylase superfamily)